MRRLVYAPKVYIFIRSSNLDGRVYDVSSDVVRGTVTQKCGDLSTASFYLRNRYQKWIRDPSSGNRQIFLPMDMVTIWLQRIAGHPVQVFTGYLDSSPYYQAYPNNALFEASCTLKKLAYTWFDPGLPFFMQWVQSTDGWTYNVATGEAQNPTYMTTGQPITSAGPGNGTTATINDGGFAELLGRFMTEIAGWDAQDVLISDLPPDIPQKAAKLYADIETDTERDLLGLSNFMAQALGVKGWNPANAQVSQGGTTVQNHNAVKEATKIALEASKANVPVLVCVFAAYVLTGLDEKFSKGPGLGSGDNWGYGLYALQPPHLDSASPFGNVSGTGSFLLSTLVDGFTPQQLLDGTTSTQVFCKRLNQNQGDWVQASKNNSLEAMTTWISKAIGRPLPTNIDLTTAFATCKQIAQSSNIVIPTQSPSVNVDPSTISFDDPTLQALLTDRDKQIIQNYYGNAKPWLAGILWRAKQVSRNMQIANAVGLGGDSILITGTASDLKTFYNSLLDTDIDFVQLISGNTTMIKQNGVTSSVATPVPGISVNSVYVLESTAPTSSSSGSTGGTSGGAATTSTSTTTTAATAANPLNNLESLSAFSANAAFAANFSFPADYLLATFLTGNRALMNDTSCLDGVKQFCSASLRQFRSLPDGRFLAFYPDYFGATRQAYWEIKNIEIVDFGIQLNDEALATHVYVVGDTFDQDGTISDYDEISTRGVATINQAFMLDSFIEPYTPPADQKGTLETSPLGRLQDAYAFLGHYGARPKMEEQPLIRNTFYEFLMAWQRFMQLWASQFATTATFTFQPEVMAGGLLAFPDHGIQMYCEEVTHNFDYSAGFDTEAVLSSPSLLAAQPDRTWKPGFALAGNVNTVGLAAGN